MGVYIKSMEMPAGPWACPFFDEYGNCAALYEVGNNYCSYAEKDDRGFPYWCPLVSVPDNCRLLWDKHVLETFGDAITAEAKKTGKERATFDEIYHVVSDVPTIIPAEEKKP